MSRVTTVLFLALALVLSPLSPAQATTPRFNGDAVTAQLPVFNVLFYGAKCDYNGTTGTDDHAAIQSAVTAAGQAGGGRILLPGRCATTVTITNGGYSNITFIGNGSDASHTDGTWVPASSLVWTGTAGGVTLKIQGTASGERPNNDGVVDIALENPGCGAADDLVIDTAALVRLSGVSFACATAHQLALQSTISVNDIGGVQHILADRLAFGDMQAQTGDEIYLSTASHNTFEDVQLGTYKNGNGITCAFCDFNDFINVRGVRASAGTGCGVEFIGITAYSNRIYELSPGTGSVCSDPGSWNTIYNFDSGDNSAPNPTISGAGPSVSTTIAAGVSAGVQTVTPGAMTNIAVGSWLRIDNGTASQEDVKVTGTTASTFTANFQFAHSANVAVAGSPAASLAWISDVSGFSGFTTAGLAFTYPHSGYTNTTTNSQAYIASANDNGLSSGFSFNVPSASTIGYQWLASGTRIAQLDASGNLSDTTTITRGVRFSAASSGFASNTDYIQSANDNGNASSLVLNVPTGSPELLRFEVNASQVGTVDTSGNIAMNGSVSGVAHHACSSSSGVPCEAGASCSISAGTTCNATTTVPSGSTCTASANSADTTTGTETWKLTLSTNTLSIAVTVSASQTSNAQFWITCL